MVAAPEQFPCANHVPLPVQDRTGQTYCYNCIIETHQSQAYNLARRLLSDWSLAEDAVQESFVSGYRAFSQFRGENLKAWVMRIVANSCRDMLRSQRARPTVSLDPTPTDSDDTTRSAVDLPSGQPSPEDLAEQGELRRTIQSGLASLSEDRRLAITLVDVQGFSYEEAAQVMNCSLGTVKSRISRARGELRDYLRGAGELLPARFRHGN
ncbi:MAG: sigma-70 family RNA polymerase sigma factor [Chloroflexi bacterium]|nr:sigma-70 family RNA polymerase sigma factor [Chloroflexota bacterium]MDA1219623.1 sigma-70 family RNA polymerase sigma factor [Chloroflexota bacterium]